MTFMQTRATKFRLFADDCLNIAERAADNERKALRLLAEIWLRLARDDLDEASREEKHRRARSEYLEGLQYE